MKIGSFRRKQGRCADGGQAMLWTVIGLGVFLLGSMAFAIDVSYLWFDRQSAQTAADAACTAGAMDLLVDATNGSTNQGGFTATAGPFDCTPSSTSSPCKYANLNGFDSSLSQANASGGTIGNNVHIDFPATVAGVSTPPSIIAPTPFMSVVVTSNVPTFFAAMLRGLTKQSVRAVAVCGVSQAAAPIPILVLDPQSPNSTPPQTALNIQGSGAIAIFGGPTRSIQVNSSASNPSCGQSNCAVNSPWGNATIDLSQAGPQGTGADIALSGAPAAAMSGFSGGTGHWIAPAAPIMDPFAQVCYPGQTTNCSATINGYAAPSVPSGPPGGSVPSDVAAISTACANFLPITSGPRSGRTGGIQGGACQVPYKFHGCPDSAGCTLYLAGPYPNGIAVGPGGKDTAIFDPGLYYVTGGLALNSGSEVRNGTGAGDGSGGVTFYFAGSGTVSVASSSGARTLDPFNTLNGPVDGSGTQYPAPNPPGSSSLAIGVKCTSTSVVPTNLNRGGAGVDLNGNVLLGPCTGYYGDPLGTSEPAIIGEQRWFLFFQDRSAQAVQPSFGGGGQFLLAGTMYFHSCNSSGSGVACIPPPTPPTSSSYYQDIFSLSGNSGAGTYVLGEIVADNLTLGGTSGISMDLNPTTAFNILKASLYQ